MRTTPATRPETLAFDPFGEPVAEGAACPSGAGDRTARRIGGAVFWSLALLILAGRIYASDWPVAQTVVAQVAHAAQVVALR